MTLAKAVVTGIVYKTPKTGYTTNNVAVSSFVLNIGEQEEMLIRVISKRQALEEVVSNLQKNQKVLVGGKLQCGVSKTDSGAEKKVFEIDAASIELIGTSTNIGDSSESDDESIIKFGDDSSSSEPIADVLMDEDEVPF